MKNKVTFVAYVGAILSTDEEFIAVHPFMLCDVFAEFLSRFLFCSRVSLVIFEIPWTPRTCSTTPFTTLCRSISSTCTSRTVPQRKKWILATITFRPRKAPERRSLKTPCQACPNPRARRGGAKVAITRRRDSSARTTIFERVADRIYLKCRPWCLTVV